MPWTNRQNDRCTSTQYVARCADMVLRCTRQAGHTGDHEARHWVTTHHWPNTPVIATHFGLSAAMTALRKEVMGDAPMNEAEKSAMRSGYEAYRNYVRQWEIERDQNKHLFMPHADDERICSVCGQASFEPMHVVTGWHREALMLREEAKKLDGMVSKLRAQPAALIFLCMVEEHSAKHVKLTCPQFPGIEQITTRSDLHRGSVELTKQITEILKANGNPRTTEELNAVMREQHHLSRGRAKVQDAG